MKPYLLCSEITEQDSNARHKFLRTSSPATDTPTVAIYKPKRRILNVIFRLGILVLGNTDFKD